MKTFFIQKNRAFTLVEVLVAIAIFSLSILSVLLILESGITNADYAKQKMTASYLAEEGIEYIRNLRDTSVLYNNSNNWITFKSMLSAGGCYGATGCSFDDTNIFS